MIDILSYGLVHEIVEGDEGVNLTPFVFLGPGLVFLISITARAVRCGGVDSRFSYRAGRSLAYCLRYIERNPLRAGLVEQAEACH